MTVYLFSTGIAYPADDPDLIVFDGGDLLTQTTTAIPVLLGAQQGDWAVLVVSTQDAIALARQGGYWAREDGEESANDSALSDIENLLDAFVFFTRRRGVQLAIVSAPYSPSFELDGRGIHLIHSEICELVAAYCAKNALIHWDEARDISLQAFIKSLG